MAGSNTNRAASDTSYFTPAQIPPAGSALQPQADGEPLPRLFQPLKIRSVEFQNRIFVSPLCQYSAQDGSLTPWHMAHLGGILMRGPGLTVIEATAVLPQGRITPEDSGLWSDAQIEPLRVVVEFAHSQGQKIGIQLAHAGRKASTVAPWIAMGAAAGPEEAGWPDAVWAPSECPYNAAHAQPKALSKEGIKEIITGFAEAAMRAVSAGMDVIEIHSAHGYLLHEFLSPFSNKRGDEYGGIFENRTRLLQKVVDAVRSAIPDHTPLFVRISATDLLEESLPDEHSWKTEDTIRLASVLAARGVDLLDVFAGGLAPVPHIGNRSAAPSPAYFAHFAEAIRKVHGVGTATGLLVGTSGGVTTGFLAEEILTEGKADVVFIGRQFQRDPATVWTFAEQLGVQTKVANQIGWGFGLNSSRRSEVSGRMKSRSEKLGGEYDPQALARALNS